VAPVFSFLKPDPLCQPFSPIFLLNSFLLRFCTAFERLFPVLFFFLKTFVSENDSSHFTCTCYRPIDSFCKFFKRLPVPGDLRPLKTSDSRRLTPGIFRILFLSFLSIMFFFSMYHLFFLLRTESPSGANSDFGQRFF